jgi:hypothetical protein
MTAAVGTGHLLHVLGRDFPSPLGLDHATQPLPHFMSRDLDLIEMGRPSTLIEGLQLRCYRRRSFQLILQLHLQFSPLRVHAICSQTL